MAENTSIIIKGARVNNLKNIDVEIPRNKLVVITGLSGSGKSSLAFDTLYAEGQRRYVESLSSYARQFLGRMSKPECDFIKGIPPAIAIEQKVSSRNPRSTVGTSTEIYEYLRLLYARVGKTFSPVSGQEVKKHSAEDIVKCMLEYPEGTKYTVLAPILLREDRTLQQQLEIDMKQGFTRLEVNGEMMRIDEYKPKAGDTVFLLIDRMTASSEKDSVSRLTDSAETAMYEGDWQRFRESLGTQDSEGRDQDDVADPQFGRIPRYPGRSAGARDRSQGSRFRRSAGSQLQGVPEAGAEERQGDGRGLHQARLQDRFRGYGQPPDARRSSHEVPRTDR